MSDRPEPTFEETADVFCEYPNCKRVASFYIGTDQTAVCVDHEHWSDASLAVGRESSKAECRVCARGGPCAMHDDAVRCESSFKPCVLCQDNERKESVGTRIRRLEADNERLRAALRDIAAQERPTHEHYEDPADCPHCRSYLLLGLETLEEQTHEF